MAKKIFLLFSAVVLLILILNYRGILKHFFPIRYNEIVLTYSTKYNLDPYLVYSIINVESKFNPSAKSKKGAAGLMQITPETGSYIAKLLNENSFDEKMLLQPDTNIRFGCFYLYKLLGDFNNDIDIALAAYNGGRGNVNKWTRTDDSGRRSLNINEIPFKETRNYIQRVKLNYKIYKFIYQ